MGNSNDNITKYEDVYVKIVWFIKVKRLQVCKKKHQLERAALVEVLLGTSILQRSESIVPAAKSMGEGAVRHKREGQGGSSISTRYGAPKWPKIHG